MRLAFRGEGGSRCPPGWSRGPRHQRGTAPPSVRNSNDPEDVDSSVAYTGQVDGAVSVSLGDGPTSPTPSRRHLGTSGSRGEAIHECLNTLSEGGPIVQDNFYDPMHLARSCRRWSFRRSSPWPCRSGSPWPRPPRPFAFEDRNNNGVFDGVGCRHHARCSYTIGIFHTDESVVITGWAAQKCPIRNSSRRERQSGSTSAPARTSSSNRASSARSLRGQSTCRGTPSRSHRT